MKLESLRQSKEWFSYLKFLGWSELKTTSGIKIAFMKTPLGAVTKIQRPPKFTEKDLLEIEKLCKKRRALFIKIEPVDEDNAKLLKKNKYVVSGHPLCPPSTSVIKLKTSEAKLWENISKSGKYSIRRAKREGSRVEFIQKPSKKEVEKIFPIIKETSVKRKFLFGESV